MHVIHFNLVEQVRQGDMHASHWLISLSGYWPDWHELISTHWLFNKNTAGDTKFEQLVQFVCDREHVAQGEVQGWHIFNN